MKFVLTLLLLLALGGILIPAIVVAAKCSVGDCASGGVCPTGTNCETGKCVYESGLNLCYPQFPGAPLLKSGIQIESLVAWLYVFLVGISGLAAFVMIVYGGVKWMISQGNPSQTTEARDIIKSALFGLLLVLASFLILQIINPELTTLKGLSLQNIPPAPAPQLTLTANGTEGSVRIPPGAVTLAWTIENAGAPCQASSDPPALSMWAGQKSSSGSELLTLNDEGTYLFAIDCPSLKTLLRRQVRVYVSSSDVEDTTVPSVNLRVRATINNVTEGYDEELTYSQDIPRGGLMTFMWSPINTHECFGEDNLLIPNSKKNDSPGSQNMGMPSSVGTHAYRITCTNLLNGQSASDTVVITVTP